MLFDEAHQPFPDGVNAAEKHCPSNSAPRSLRRRVRLESPRACLRA
jgi:hypothetical protein